jgi:hypothetical protein
MATNLLDEFVVSIGLDPSAYTKGEREATDAFNKTKDAAVKSGKEIEERSKSTAEMFGKLRNQVVALFAVFTGGVGLKEFVSTMTAADAATGRLATTLGISVGKLSTYEGAWKLAGGTAQGAANAITSMADKLQEFLSSGSSDLPGIFTVLQREGGKFIDVNKPVPKLIDDIAEALAKMAEKNPERATFYAKKFPGMAELMPILALKDGYEKFLALKKEADQYKTRPEDTEAAARLLLLWDRLDMRWRRVGEMLYTSLEPALEAIGVDLLALADWAIANPDTVKLVFEGITAAVVALGAAITVNIIGSNVIGAFKLLTGAVRGLAIGFGLLDVAAAPWLAAATLMAAAVLAIYENWEPIKAWWKDLWSGMGKVLDDYEASHPWIKPLRDVGDFLNKDRGGAIFGKDYDAWKAGTQDAGGNKTGAAAGAPAGAGAGAGSGSAGTGAGGGAASAPGSPTSPRGATSPSETEAYIRQAAIARGIDPNIAVRVAKSEGLNSYVGDRGTSFGPFQLHYKNNIPGLSLGGLGDVFTKQTGLNARDPSTTRQQIDFALDQAAKGGWGPWHGWHGAPNAGIGRRPAPAAAAATLAPPSVWDKVAAQPSLATAAQSAATQGDVWNDNRSTAATNSTTNHEVNINGPTNIHTQATDAAGVARDWIGSVMRAHKFASGNYGTQGP